MKRKALVFTSLFASLAIGGAIYGYVSLEDDSFIARVPASSSNYESLQGCAKQTELWSHIEKSSYESLPNYDQLGVIQLIKMARQEIIKKAEYHSDFAPDGWKKYLHRRGAIAKVKIVPHSDSYTGIFEGAECALLRLSLTYSPKGGKPVAPGLALKVLRDKTYSANISALVSLEGQEKNFNFFQNPMSNIVPIGDGLGQKLVHRIFKKVTRYPEELLLEDMANLGTDGEKVSEVKSPRQIFFVPNSELHISSEEHDVRDDFLTIPEGTLLYKVYAVNDKQKNFDYSLYTHEKAGEFLTDAIHIADIISTSAFKASQFGDDGIFFKHQIRP